MYRASYKRINFITGETVLVQEYFSTSTDARTFLEQAEYSLHYHSLEWKNSDYRIDCLY